MRHVIVVEIPVRTVDDRGGPIPVIEPTYHLAYTDAVIKAHEEAKWLGLYQHGSIDFVESEFISWDDPNGVLRFSFIYEMLGE